MDKSRTVQKTNRDSNPDNKQKAPAPRENIDKDDNETSDSESTFAGHANINFGWHQTCTAMCIGEKGSTQINVIFDGGSPVSFLEESLAKNLGLKPLRKDVLSLEGICAVKHSQQKYNRYDVTLQSISDDKQYNLQVYGLNKICSVNHQ